MPRQLLELEQFFLTHPNWAEELTEPPYCLKIKTDGNYVIFTYNMLNSDFSLPIVRESRGTIFYNNNGILELVCLPFTKFFNYGEQYAAEIDWRTPYITEKIDGSLLKLWYHNDAWHLSTNGMIDAFKAPIGDTEFSFGDRFEQVIETDIQTFGNQYLRTDSIYMYELVDPVARVVIPYEHAALYKLSARNMTTLQEFIPETPSHVQAPKVYNLRSFDACLTIVNQMNRNHEGVVVCDGSFHRVKVKSPEYLAAAHLNNNGIITTKRILTMLRNGQLDDFVAYLPQHRHHVDAVLNKMRNYIHQLDTEWDNIPKTNSQKDMFRIAAQTTDSRYIMLRYNSKIHSAEEYINNMPIAKLSEILRKE